MTSVSDKPKTTIQPFFIYIFLYGNGTNLFTIERFFLEFVNLLFLNKITKKQQLCNMIIKSILMKCYSTNQK